MKPHEKKWNVGLLTLCCVVAVAVLLLNLLYTDTLAGTYNDNTTVWMKLNVSNVAPTVRNVNLYDSNHPANIVLEQGTTHTIVCNATINDTNGYGDIATVNASLYKYSEYGPGDVNDNNFKYANTSCNQYATSGVVDAFYTCQFEVEYYAYNGTWRCNVTAIDSSDATNNSADDDDIDSLFAINLSNTTISFGELEPMNTSEDRELNVTNFGNMNLTISLRAYGEVEGDDWAMNCSTGNISLDYERFSLDSGTAWGSMTPVTNTFADINGLTVYQRTDDSDDDHTDSHNATYWKIKAPLGTKGVCNGTLELSAKNPFV